MIKTGTTTERKKLILNFERAHEMMGHPMMMEISGKSEEMYMFAKDIRRVMHRYLDKYLSINKEKE